VSLKAFIAREWWETPDEENKPEIPDPQRAKFLMRIPDASGVAVLENEGNFITAGPMGEKVMKMASGTVALLALRVGLRGWLNITDENGQQKKFTPIEDGLCPLENIEAIRPALRNELASKFLKKLRLSEEDVKN